MGRNVVAAILGSAAGLGAGLAAVALQSSVAIYLAAVIGVGILVTAVIVGLWSPPGLGRPMTIVLVIVLLLAIAAPRPLAAGPDNDRGPSLFVGRDNNVFTYDQFNPGASDEAAPLIFLHGGPGVSTRAQDRPWLAALSRNRTVIAYDQLGAGGSSRLQDPTAYSLEGATQALEDVRASWGFDRMILVGHSWGAVVAANYAAQHTDHVEALIALAPGSLDPDAEDADDPSVRLHGRDRVRLLSRLLRPRELYTYGLASIDPVTAHRIAGDAEMDRRYDAILKAVWPAMFCEPAEAARREPPSAGFYSHQRLQRQPAVYLLESPVVDPPPTLVIKPQCDYLPWSVVDDYVTHLDAQVAYVANAGHSVHLEQREVVTELLESFLIGETPEEVLVDPRSAPSSFEGPP